MFGQMQTIFRFRGVFGVPVEVDGSLALLFLLLFGFTGGMEGLVFSGILATILVGSIYLHELGHAWGALVQGVPVKRIVIHGGGGFCEQARSATTYKDELIVAMGPIVNLSIWALVSLFAPDHGNPIFLWALATLAQVNFFLGVMNLMPVMPLDGGKLFHLGLLRVLRPNLAMRVAGGVGLIIVIAWIPAMIFAWSVLGFILLFFPSFRIHLAMLRGQLG